MPRLRTSVLICLLCGWASCRARRPVGTIYGSVSHEARQVSAARGPCPCRRNRGRRRCPTACHVARDAGSPMPERMPLAAKVTGVLDRGDYVVEKVHFSLPGAYVIGNIYRRQDHGRLRRVVSLRAQQGKVNPPYQANALVWTAWLRGPGAGPDPVGRVARDDHGTYSKDRWDWPSCGYTPPAREVWNAMP